jgi:hypothetical protein
MCSDNERAVPRIHLHTVQRDTEWAAALSQLDDAPLGVVLASPSSCDPRRRPEAPVTESEVRLLAPRLGLATSWSREYRSVSGHLASGRGRADPAAPHGQRPSTGAPITGDLDRSVGWELDPVRAHRAGIPYTPKHTNGRAIVAYAYGSDVVLARGRAHGLTPLVPAQG